MTFDYFFLANIPYVREIMAEILDEKYGIRLGEFEYQICPVADLEDLCRLLSVTRQRLSDAVASKVDNTDEVPLDRPRREWEFGAWVSKVWPDPHEGGSLPSHDRVYQHELARIIEKLRQPSAADG